MALHRDPERLGSEPDAFDPENFSREAEAKRPINAWKPFGNGQRACIGRGFAMHEAALAIGMILQRFKLIDVHRYQMHLKETLTIKPDGFKIKVRPRTDAGPRRVRGAALPRPRHRRTPRPPRARTRPGHNTPLLVLYGSNLGSAEELATRVADLAEVNGFATKARAARRLRGQTAGAGRRADLLRLLQWCAARQRHAIRQMARRRSAKGCVRQGCATPCSAAATATGPRPISRCRGMIDEQLAAHGARSVYARGEGDARSDLDGQFEKWFARPQHRRR